jgi:CHASE3 domain sensor protein
LEEAENMEQQLSSRQRILLRVIVAVVIILLLAVFGLLSRTPALHSLPA